MVRVEIFPRRQFQIPNHWNWNWNWEFSYVPNSNIPTPLGMVRWDIPKKTIPDSKSLELELELGIQLRSKFQHSNTSRNGES
jgi:hypothetical protein